MVKAVISKRRTTIDNDTGAAAKEVTGTIEGMTDGLRRWAEQGARIVQPDIAVHIGQFPEGHPMHPSWAVQVLLSPFETSTDAEAMSDRVENTLRKAFVQ